jgi:hypothetical protein
MRYWLAGFCAGIYPVDELRLRMRTKKGHAVLAAWPYANS